MHQALYLRRKEAAAYLRARYGFGSSSSHAKLALTGEGPVFQKAGQFALYTDDALDAWASNKIGAPVRSTSEAGSARKPRSDCPKPPIAEPAAPEEESSAHDA